MSGPLLYDFSGLVTAPGLLARNPASCVAVSNFRFPAPGVMRKRTGFELGAQATAVVKNFTSVIPSKTLGTRVLAYSPEGEFWIGGPAVAWAKLTSPSIYAPSGSVARGALLGPGHYLVSGGVYRVESDLTSFQAAGMPRGLAPTVYSMNAAVYSVLQGAPGTLLADGSNVAYRVTWHRKDASGNFELGGPPSSRLVVRNIGGTSGYAGGVVKNVRLRIPLVEQQDTLSTPVGTSYFWRLWRSRISATDTADDEMYLVAEAFVTATDVANGYAQVDDLTPDAFLLTSPRLHTNAVNFPPLEAGVLNGQTNADEAPPRAGDVASFAGCMFYAALTFRAFQALALIALPAVNETLAFVNSSGHTITLKCVAGAPANPGEYTLVAGLATLGLNIEATARNMIDAFVLASLGVGAGLAGMYVSQGTQLPGQMAFEFASALTTFAITPSNAAAGAKFRPAVPAGGLAVQPVSQANLLAFSKLNRPDAVPPVNQMVVGPAASSVLRIVAFRERLLCFTNEGLYAVDGTDYSNFRVSLVDSSLRLLAPETVCVLEDRCYAWCKEGVAEISSGGRTIISAPIEPTLQAILTAAVDANGSPSGVINGAFAVADRKSHRVMFFYTPADASFARASSWLEWDARERKWSTGTFAQPGDNATARLSTSGQVVPTSALNGTTLSVEISTDGGLTFPTTRSHVFVGEFNTINDLFLDLDSDAVFQGTELFIAETATELLILTTAMGYSNVIRIKSTSTAVGAGKLQFTSLQTSGGTEVDTVSCGCTLYSSDVPLLANAEAAPATPTRPAKAWTARTSFPYQDDRYNGTSRAIRSSATFQFQTPDTDARHHWQQLLLMFEAGEQSAYPLPSGVTLTWDTDTTPNVGGASYAVTRPILRVETPSLARRATRQRVTLGHVLAEHLGLVALNQTVARSEPARFPK